MNEALIAKQVWRIITRPDLLMSKVIKARYFPTSDFMEASSGSRPSLVWRSLIRVKYILKEGLSWDLQDKKFCWNKCNSRLYTTRSGYEVAKSLRKEWVGQSLDCRKIKILWNRLWRIHVPNKLKLLLWRLYHNIWHVAQNLTSRGIPVDMSCKICGVQLESIMHLLSRCWWAKALWSFLGIHFFPDEDLLGSAKDWLWKIAMSRDEEEMLRICDAVWIIWAHRNEVWHDKELWDVKWASRRVDLYCRFWNNKTPLLSSNSACDPLKWKPPKKWFLKFNGDGAWCTQSN
ncbi:hypothetical protein QQ045_010097 [Rhodiola kirilowii]